MLVSNDYLADDAAIACRRATRSSVDGWVENNFDNPLNAESGLTCASGATDGDTSIGIRRADFCNLSNVLARASGLPEISAPTASV